MLLGHEFHSGPSHVTVTLQEISTHAREEDGCGASVCKSGEVEGHGDIRSCHLDTFHCTRSRLGSAAFLKLILVIMRL